MGGWYVRAYWGDREELAVECAERLSACLAELANADPLLGTWRHLGRSKATAKGPVGTQTRDLEQLLVKGRHRRDTDRSVMEELGFRIGMWNGQEPAVGLSASVGGYAGAPGIVNSFGIDLPTPVGDAARLYRSDTARRIMEAIVEAWEPDWATWVSHPLREVQDAPARTPVVGWMTFLDGARIAPDSAVSVGGERLRGGWLVRVADEVSRVDEDSVVALRRSLHTAGALVPTP